MAGTSPRNLAERREVELSVVMPCLNEEGGVGGCIEQIAQALAKHKIAGEIIVADNGSSDRSREISCGLGAQVVVVEEKGYGSALMAGIAAARGKYIIMGDSDGTYDFAQIPAFLSELRSGYDLVMGNRFQGRIQAGAMPPLHKYLGNPVLTGIGRTFAVGTTAGGICASCSCTVPAGFFYIPG